jgi:glycosyltransferase involved in cell wall biosynthesis
LGTRQKIVVIPHGSETTISPPAQAQARRTLGLPEHKFIVLAFGFLAWYKGTDALVAAFSRLPDEKKNAMQLIIAGGDNPNYLDKEYYRSYRKRIKKAAAEGKGITITGFVPEEQIAAYFAASDVVVFPYRTLMSSSGPFSFSLSYHKPFLLSDRLSGLFKTADFKAVLQETQTNREDLTLSLADPMQAVVSLLSDTKKLHRLSNLSRLLGDKRTWEKIGEQYYETLFT